jgi:hypothetical protein
MPEDTVIQEVRRIKADIAAKHGYNIRAIVEEARQLCRQKGRSTVSRPPKRVTPR